MNKDNDFFDEITDEEYSSYGYEDDKYGCLAVLAGIILGAVSVFLVAIFFG